MKRNSLTTDDTIFAPATPRGKSALAILRMSGRGVRNAINSLCRMVPDPGHLKLARIRNLDGSELDQGMVVFFPAPRTATGEDVGEFHLHGSPHIVAVLSEQLRQLGLRLAEPGEFTRRAVLAGKMDLAQAEALADLLDAETEAQRKQAIFQLYGGLSDPVIAWRDQLCDALALFEAALDFSDEGDVEEVALCHQALEITSSVFDELQQAIALSSFGERVRDGFKVVISGPVNAGKSTLLNCLAGRDVALVTDIPGTTRDVVSVNLDLSGFPVRLVDTAGIRETGDVVEKLGIERGVLEADSADLIMWMTPIAGTTPNQLAEVRRRYPKALLVGSQIDLMPDSFSIDGYDVCISARTGAGLDTLIACIGERLSLRSVPEGVLITRARQRQAIVCAMDALIPTLARKIEGVRPMEIAICAEDLRHAIYHLGLVTGHVSNEMILDRIFADFCIGK